MVILKFVDDKSARSITKYTFELKNTDAFLKLYPYEIGKQGSPFNLRMFSMTFLQLWHDTNILESQWQITVHIKRKQ